jgi:O-glycosyl hydrolase
METIYWLSKSNGNLISHSGILAHSPRRWHCIGSQRGTLHGLLLTVAMVIALTSYAAAMPGSADATGKPTVTPNTVNVTPGSGAVGAAVVISGTNFGATQGTSRVTFGGVQAAPTNWSGTSIVAPVPAGAVTGNIVVTVGGQASNSSTFTVNTATPAPSITSLSPNSGAVGTAVTITGANFGTTQGTSTVTFGGVKAAPTKWSGTSIVAPVPAGAVTGNVVVTVGGQASNGSSFKVTTGPPSIKSLGPGSGVVGTAVAISGANFGTKQGTSIVTFGGMKATPTSWNGTSIVVPVPAGAVTGSVEVAVGGQASNGMTFTVVTGQTSIHWNSMHQPIDGFGVAVAGDTSSLTTSLADAFFRTDTGIGLSIVRSEVIPDTATCNAYFGTGACIASSNATILNGELQIMKQAQARGVTTFFGSSWSPPASMKSNGSWGSGGSFIGNTTNYAAFATLLASYVTLLKANGVPLVSISPQNEPEVSQPYQSATWTAQEFHDFIPHLHTALGTAGVSSTQIMFPENACWSTNYHGLAATSMNDSSVAQDVGVMAQHGYCGPATPVAVNTYGKHLWMTEVSSQWGGYDGSMTEALPWATLIHKYLTISQVNGFVWWCTSDASNACLADSNNNLAHRAYATGNWSKFVRPGWFRIDVTDTSGLEITAFKDAASRKFAVVVVNSGSSKSNTFTLNGFSAASVTPWITDATRSLIQESNVTVSGGAFSYSIPANSVVTFAGRAQ